MTTSEIRYSFLEDVLSIVVFGYIFVYLMLVVLLDLLCITIFVYTTAVTGCGVEDHTTSRGVSVD